MKKQLNRQELSFFFGQLAMILHAGISVLEGILILKEDAPGGEGTEILTDIQESLETKGILWEALKDSGVFPEYAVHMTEVGERCGTLEEVFSSLSSYYEKEEALIKGIRDSLSYPAVMFAMLCGVLVVLAVKVMPVFNQVFQDLGTEMTGLPEAVLILERCLAVMPPFLSASCLQPFYSCSICAEPPAESGLEPDSFCFSHGPEGFQRRSPIKFCRRTFDRHKERAGYGRMPAACSILDR